MPGFCYSGGVKDRTDSNQKAWWIQTIQPSLPVAMEIDFIEFCFNFEQYTDRVGSQTRGFRREKETTALHGRPSVSLK